MLFLTESDAGQRGRVFFEAADIMMLGAAAPWRLGSGYFCGWDSSPCFPAVGLRRRRDPDVRARGFLAETAVGHAWAADDRWAAQEVLSLVLLRRITHE
jgi:hypothetical protein